MASPRVSTKLRKPRSSENLTSLSEEVLRIHLQALNPSIIGRKAVLVRRLKAATHPRKGITSRPSKTQAVTRANTSTRSTRRATSAHHQQLEPATLSSPSGCYIGRRLWGRAGKDLLWLRTSRRQRITQGIILLPLLSSPLSRTQGNPLWIAHFKAFPSRRISLS